MVPLAPVMLALSANCPIVRGFLTERDCRWDMISASVDTRRDEEIAELKALNAHTAPPPPGLAPRRTGEEIGESGGSFYGEQHKSRYAGVSLYIDNSAKFKEKYNDVP